MAFAFTKSSAGGFLIRNTLIAIYILLVLTIAAVARSENSTTTLADLKIETNH